MDKGGGIMASLAQLQDGLLDHILRQDQAVAAEIVGTSRVPVDVRLAIYAEGYPLRLIEALEENFPALHTLLGDEAWEEMTRRYIAQTPSRHFSIRYFGNRLPEFLRDTPPYRNEACLAEMAHFEWLLRDVFDARDALAVEFAQLTKAGIVDWASVVFQLHPTVRFTTLYWNVPSLWKAIEQESEPVPPEYSDSPVFWMVWRADLTTYFRSLDHPEQTFYLALQSGKSFGVLCDELASIVGEQEAIQLAAGFVRRAIDDGLITRFLGGEENVVSEDLSTG